MGHAEIGIDRTRKPGGGIFACLTESPSLYAIADEKERTIEGSISLTVRWWEDRFGLFL